MVHLKGTAGTGPTTAITLGAAIFVSIVVSSYHILYRRRVRSRWQEILNQKHGQDEGGLPSIISHFNSLTLDDPNTTVEEANKRRTVGYYEKAREAHLQSLVIGIWPYSHLMKLRRKEMDGRIMKYWNEFQGQKSHRTIICMCDSATSSVLNETREKILEPLRHSTNIATQGVWIPELNIIPEKDMHVTVIVPWWWHTIQEENHALSKSMASRFRQALVMDFHHPFQIELERIVLLGGKALVALWRTVGERKNEDGLMIYDRHGENTDPFVKLRKEIINCFTTEDPNIRRQPLTYTHQKVSGSEDHQSTETLQRKSTLEQPPMPKRNTVLLRQNTIESKTPGLGQKDGFIHTTLCRLPLNCLSQQDVELEQIHRLCREATATYCGHRMVVSKFRFLETTGKGGESNPCIDPIYDETIEAPSRLDISRYGVISETDNLHLPQQHVERGSTIGALPESGSRNTIQDLFSNMDSSLQEDIDEEAT